MERLAGKAAIVTGAAQGIGRGIVEALVAAGAEPVVAFDVDGPKLDAALAEMGDERVVPFVGDVSSTEDVRGAIDLSVRLAGHIDVMCAHTGISEPRELLLTTDEHWRRHMAVNVDGTFACVREAARAMVDGTTHGAIVVTASINAWFVEETMAAYNTTKAACWAITRSAAIDLGRYGIRVNAVAPGVVDTPLAALVVQNPDLAPQYLKTIPLGRFGLPSDVGNAVVFLASDDASYVTGQMLVIDGGQTLGITGDLETAHEATAHEAGSEGGK